MRLQARTLNTLNIPIAVTTAETATVGMQFSGFQKNNKPVRASYRPDDNVHFLIYLPLAG